MATTTNHHAPTSNLVSALTPFVSGEMALSELDAEQLVELAAIIQRLSALVDWFDDGNRKLGKITDELTARGIGSAVSEDSTVRAAVKRPPKKTIDVPSVLYLTALRVWASDGELPAQVGAYLTTLGGMLNDNTWTWSAPRIEAIIGQRDRWERVDVGSPKLDVRRVIR